MTGRNTALLLAGTSLFAMALLASVPAQAQENAPGKGPCIGCSVDGKTTPRTPDGHPDLSGYWGGAGGGGGFTFNQQFSRAKDGSILFDFDTGFNDRAELTPCAPDDDSARCLDPNEPSYKPEYFAKVKKTALARWDGSSSEDPMEDCKPLGIPRANVNGIQIVQGPQSIAILYESAPYSLFRVVYMDGRPHPDDLDTSYMGHSIGHWEGDTLVVDVAGLSDETWLAGGVLTKQKYAIYHSDKEHVIERWTRDGDTLTYEATVDDPVMFTKPWVITPRKVQHHGPVLTSDDEILEQRCTVNDKNHYIKPNAEDKPKCEYRCGPASK